MYDFNVFSSLFVCARSLFITIGVSFTFSVNVKNHRPDRDSTGCISVMISGETAKV